MPSFKVIETLAELAAGAGEKILPSKLLDVLDAISGKSEGLAAKAGGRLAAPLDRELAGSIEIPPLSSLPSSLSAGNAEIVRANQALVNHVTDLMPQVDNGKLDWILGGSGAANLFAGAKRITLLDSARFPEIVPTRTIELSNSAVDSFGGFVRKVGDIDAFVVKGGQNKFLGSPHLGSMNVDVPDAALGALRATGETRYKPLIQGVQMEFDNTEVAAVESGGKTVYVTGPGQLMGNKMRQVLMSYAPADAEKLTGDFAHLADATSSIYSEPELLQFGRQALMRNSLIYKDGVLVPWDKSAENTRFVQFLRNVLESEPKVGSHIQGLNIEDRHSLAVWRLLDRYPQVEDRAALTDFLNRHGDLLRAMDKPGSAERAIFLKQGGTGKASEKLLRALDNLAQQNANGEQALKEQLPGLESKFFGS